MSTPTFIYRLERLSLGVPPITHLSTHATWNSAKATAELSVNELLSFEPYGISDIAKAGPQGDLPWYLITKEEVQP